jgi:hypothetical protein
MKGKAMALCIRNARFSTIGKDLRISQDPESAVIIEIDPFGNNHWVTVDYSKVCHFKQIVQAYKANPQGKFLLAFNAESIIFSSGGLSPETAGSIVPNRWVVIATEASLIRMP